MKTSTEVIIMCLGCVLMSFIFYNPGFNIVSLFLYPAYFICRAIEDKK